MLKSTILGLFFYGYMIFLDGNYRSSLTFPSEESLESHQQEFPGESVLELVVLVDFSWS